MSGDNGKLKPEESQEEKKEKHLTIVLSREKGLFVEGPGNGKLYDEPMCYYMLEKAKDFIKASNAHNSKPILQKSGGIMDFARGGFRK